MSQFDDFNKLKKSNSLFQWFTTVVGGLLVLVLFDLFSTTRNLVKSIEDNTQQLEKNALVMEYKVDRLEKRLDAIENSVKAGELPQKR
jgi:hypothetical protein